MSAPRHVPLRPVYGTTRVPRAWWSARRILRRGFGYARSGRRVPAAHELHLVEDSSAITRVGARSAKPFEVIVGDGGDRQPLHGIGSLPHREEVP